MRPELPGPIQSTMNDLTSGLLTILGSRLIGVYLGGSLALGDFADSTDNLDFLVVTDGPLSPEDLVGMSQLHRELRDRHPYASRLEGDYASLEVIVPTGTACPVPGCERGVFLPRVGEVVLTSLTLETLRQRGIIVYGAHPREVLPPISPAEIRQAAADLLTELPRAGATPAETAALLLNRLRSAQSLETGELSTKSGAVEWALSRLDPSWHGTIKAAVAMRLGEATPEDEALLEHNVPDLINLLRSPC